MKTILFVLLLILCISQTKNKILCNCGWILIALLLLNSLNEGFTCSDVPVINVPGGRRVLPAPSPANINHLIAESLLRGPPARAATMAFLNARGPTTA